MTVPWVVSLWLLGGAPDPGAAHLEPALRRPIALAVDEARGLLFAAHRRSGSISVVDTRTLAVRREAAIGSRLSDLQWLPGEHRLLALDEAGHELIVLAPPELNALHRVPVSRFPVTVSVTPDGRRGFVAGLWSRRLDLFELPDEGAPVRRASLALPFAPREQLLLPDGRNLLVADGFGGRLAIVDIETAELRRVADLPAHNIRGLALSADGERVLVSHQNLDRSARANREDILWGVLMSNGLLALPVGPLLAGGDPLRGSRFLDLGAFFTPSGDPEQVILTGEGEVAVALGGAGRIAVGQESWPRLDSVAVGRRPTALAASGDRLYVANTFSDSIAVVDVRARRVIGNVVLGPAAPLSEADRGELLFYDAELSLRGWMSCHSCHTDGHANGALADTLGDGAYGAPKRVPSLLGVGASGPWAWNGSLPTLAAQIEKSILNTLQARDVAPEDVRAIEAFLRTLEPPEIPPDVDEAAILRGREVFQEVGCDRCHRPPAYTSEGTRDVGLADETGNRRFNPPSLRGVAHRSSFFHDGRAKSLRDVFSVVGHPVSGLSGSRIDDLIAFLSTLD